MYFVEIYADPRASMPNLTATAAQALVACTIATTYCHIRLPTPMRMLRKGWQEQIILAKEDDITRPDVLY